MSDSRIEICAGDITQLDADAIVNAANESLAPGGGVWKFREVPVL